MQRTSNARLYASVRFFTSRSDTIRINLPQIKAPAFQAFGEGMPGFFGLARALSLSQQSFHYAEPFRIQCFSGRQPSSP